MTQELPILATEIGIVLGDGHLDKREKISQFGKALYFRSASPSAFLLASFDY